MSETTEKSQAIGTSKGLPQVTLPQPAYLPETDTLSIMRSELDRARDEYQLGHFKELLANLSKLIGRLEQSEVGTEGSLDAPQFHLIYATALTIQGQALQRLRQDSEAGTSFQGAVAEFKKWFLRADPAPEAYCNYGVALYYGGQIAEAINMLAIGTEKGSRNAEAYRLYGTSLSSRDPARLPLAEKQLRESLNLNQNDPLTHQALGENLEQQGKLEEAVDCYRRAAAQMFFNDMFDEARTTVAHALELNPDDAELLAIKGYILLSEGTYEEALRVFDESLSHAPDNATTLGMKGQTLALLSRETEALECLHRAIELNGSEPLLFFLLGAVLRSLGRYEEALVPLDKAVKLAPDNVQALVFSGSVLHELHHNDRARELLERAVDLDRAVGVATSGHTFMTLGETLVELGQHEEALRAFDQALALSPNDPGLVIAKAQSLRLLGRGAEAVQLLKLLVESNPESAFAYARLADVLYASRNYEEALKNVETALELMPTYVDALVVRGRILRALDRYTEAVQVLQEAVKLEPSWFEPLAELGAALRKVGRWDESLQALDKALESQPDSTHALRYKAETLSDLARHDESLKVLEHALAVAPDDPWLLVSKGAVLRHSNHPSEAIEILKHALDRNPDLARGWAELGAALYTEDHNEDALLKFERALALKPNYDLALKYKGETLRFLGRYEEALVCLDRALAISPDDGWTLGAKGQTLRSLGRELEASETLKLAVSKGPELSWAWAELGFSYHVQEQPEEALAAFKKALAISFNVDWALFTAFIYCNIAEYASAIPILDKAIEIQPENGELFGLKGWVLENLGLPRAEEAYQAYKIAHNFQKDELAWYAGLANGLYLLKKLPEARVAYREVLTKALEITTPTSDTLTLIGWSHYRLEEYDEAIKTFIALVRDNPADISDQFNLALTLFGSNQPALARREYERGIEMASRKPIPLQRGWLHVAIDDMDVALEIEPTRYKTGEFEQARELLQNTYDASKKDVQLVSKNRNVSNSDTAVV
jgi:tetratricopeptide (TPR) repeat protein